MTAFVVRNSDKRVAILMLLFIFTESFVFTDPP
jgi:hypothetical protein